ncbi:MAG TPA: amidohydrolase/deacetylase family metallohydrolase [Chloroflexota bacterium]|nr:amidohydrolase/deacetylase family metallohydrolase [Chloroflexota bacterium]
MANFDLLIRNGRVIDPGSNRDGLLDVAIADGKIAAVAPNLPVENARETFDASGLLVTPGLVDLHTHVYWGASYWGIEADPVAARSGVTTWLDVGTSGSYNFPGFRRWIIGESQARIFSLLNLSSIGLTANTYELANLDYCDVGLAEQVINQNRDVILGIKARIDRNTTRGTGIEPLKRARELSNRVALPLMVHIGYGPPTIQEILEYLRPGDILTHCCTGGTHRLIDAERHLLPRVKELRERGVVLDIGHGTGSFSFDTAEAFLAEGILPDVISSDIHQMSVQGPMYDLPTCLAKFLALGLSLSQVIERATTRPAKAMGKTELGTLAVGAPADVAVFALREGQFTFHDVALNARTGRLQLDNVRTIVGGNTLALTPELPLHPWATLPAAQREIRPRP